MSKKLNAIETQNILNTLKLRFEQNQKRHPNLNWKKIQKRLEDQPNKIWSLNEMEKTGGEPDVISFNEETEEYLFMDCCKESPSERRSLCYDNEALNSRKDNKPNNSAVAMAEAMNVNLLTESQYKMLQEIEEFDLKTSNWIQTPSEIRNLGGALFADYRYKTTFIYHNGAQSYYAVRGFRCSLTV